MYHKLMEKTNPVEFGPSELPKEVIETLKVEEQEEPAEHKTQTLLQKIQSLKVGEKIQLAMKGGREIRSILVRDSSKEVVSAVLENQKISDSEIELITKQKTSSEEVLRIISKKKEWLKKYSILYALVTNPKTPPGAALSNIRHIKTKDLGMISKNKSVTEAVRAAAKKILAERTPH
ncbi:MAG: hypothetical protein HY759_00610 [Nitrospirae bacterium]|nr:hypothetical protein [Nitrospirota bacterium]